MADISAFKAQMKAGGARANAFKFILPFPAGIGIANSTLAGSKVEFMAKAAELPAANIAPIEIMYRGRSVHFAGERAFDPLNIQVYNDNDFILRNAFEGWVNAISRAESSNGLLNPASYQADMEVQQLDRNDNILKRYVFKNAFPTSVGAIPVSWDQNNVIEEYPVSFVYTYWQPA